MSHTISNLYDDVDNSLLRMRELMTDRLKVINDQIISEDDPFAKSMSQGERRAIRMMKRDFDDIVPEIRKKLKSYISMGNIKDARDETDTP